MSPPVAVLLFGFDDVVVAVNAVVVVADVAPPAVAAAAASPVEPALAAREALEEETPGRLDCFVSMLKKGKVG